MGIWRKASNSGGPTLDLRQQTTTNGAGIQVVVTPPLLMATKSLSLDKLDTDVLHLICEEVSYVLRFDKRITAGLLPLSGTCKRLRGLISPSIFRRVRNMKRSLYESDHHHGNEFWPPSIWKYIEIVDLYGCRPGKAETFETFASVIPQLPYLKKVCFKMEQTPPRVLLSSTAAAGIGSLELENTRLDGPPVTDIFSRFRLTNLLLTVNAWRPKDLNAQDELAIVANILSIASETLLCLRISGDLVSFETLARLDWPCLCTLTLTDHVPYGMVMPLPTVISHMPRLRNLHYNFYATSARYIPPILYWHESLSSPPLAVTHPHLASLSMSNIYPAEHTLDRLPESLRSLRIFAFRERARHTFNGPWYPYYPLEETDAFRIIAKAALLPDLVDLALTLEDLPSPTVIEAVAKSCPGLRFLEIGQSEYEHNRAESPYPIEFLIEPLTRLCHLRELRISIGFGSQYNSTRYRGLLNKRPLFERMDAAANIFAQRLATLNFLSFSFSNDGDYNGLEGPLLWYRYGIFSSVDGKPHVAMWDLDSLYEVSSEPDDSTCRFA